MTEIVILKNKNATITKTIGEDSKIEKITIEKPQFNIVEYTLNDEGKILKNGKAEEVESPSLESLSEVEKRQFYKQLLQGQYSEIENIIVLSGAGTSVGIGKVQKGLTMAQLWDSFEESDKEVLDKLIKETGYSLSWENGKLKKDLETVLKPVISG